MSHAMTVLNYNGTVVFFKNGHLDAMKYSHSTLKGLEQERLLSLNSPLREITRDAGRVRCVFKESDKVVINHHPVSKSFIVDLPVDFSAVNSFYHFALQGDASIAMQAARVISIEAKDSYRYNRKIWIDKQKLLPLKVEVFSLSGATLEQVVFTDLQIAEELGVINKDEKINASAAKHIHEIASSSFDDADFLLLNMPEGFKTVFFTQMKMANSEQMVDHLLLSDGFSSVSVYRELKADDTPAGLQTLGAVNSFTHVMGDFHITAMGEVPAKTVQFIAQGAQLR
ncbi:MAG: MucB/RseB C-terminal domain-containing protein [Methylococcales bacterium]|nr:MucB/RseB C-terminal domain-containing protein [Methylococcales bacterium]